MRVYSERLGVTGMTSLTLRQIVANELGARKGRVTSSFRNDSAAVPHGRGDGPDTASATMRAVERSTSFKLGWMVEQGLLRSEIRGLVSEAQAIDVARRVLLRVQCDENPATERAIIRAIPTFDSFADEYWEKMQAVWKSGTISRNIYYMRKHVRPAFADSFSTRSNTSMCDAGL